MHQNQSVLKKQKKKYKKLKTFLGSGKRIHDCQVGGWYETFNTHAKMMNTKTSAIPRDQKFFGVLVGDARVGKTRFTEMALDGKEFVPTPNHRYVPTVGAEIHPVATIEMENGKTGGLMLADVGCSDKYTSIRPGTYANLVANGMVDKFIVVHRGNPQKWIDEIRANCPDTEILELDMRTMNTSADARTWIENNIAKVMAGC